MAEHEFSVTRIFQYKDKLFDYEMSLYEKIRSEKPMLFEWKYFNLEYEAL